MSLKPRKKEKEIAGKIHV